MAKLSKAQEKVLNKIKDLYTVEHLQESIKYYNEKIESAKDEDWRIWYTEQKKMYENGWIRWVTKNSRTLEILAEQGYIEYIKEDEWRRTPVDWVRLVEK